MEKSPHQELTGDKALEAERRRRRFRDASQDLLAVISVAGGKLRLVNEQAWLQTPGYSSAIQIDRHLLQRAA